MIVKSNRTKLRLLRLNERAREVPKVFEGDVLKRGMYAIKALKLMLLKVLTLTTSRDWGI